MAEHGGSGRATSGGQEASALAGGLQLSTRLWLSFLTVGVILVVEVAGGLLSNSLALLSDAGHVFTHLFALALGWLGIRQSLRLATGRMTFGYLRIDVLFAAINAVTLLGIALAVIYGSYLKFRNPQPVTGSVMLVVALFGLLANLLVAFLLSSGARVSLNVRSILWHVWGDTLSSVVVVFGGAFIALTSWYWVDPAASVLIALLIAYGAFRILREGVNIFLEATPGHLSLEKITRAIGQVPGVVGVHDLHVWTISPQLHTLSCHIVVEDRPVSQTVPILKEIEHLLGHEFDIGHSTIQFETLAWHKEHLHGGREEGIRSHSHL